MLPRDGWTEQAGRWLASRTTRRSFLGKLGQAGQDIEIDHPRRPAPPANAAKSRLGLKNARQKLIGRQRGLDRGDAVDVPRLAVVRHRSAAIPPRAPAHPYAPFLQSGERGLQGRLGRTESPTRQVATETKKDHVR